jgi:hypothetical protein
MPQKIFLFEAESTPGPWYGRKDYVNANFQLHHRTRDLRLVVQCFNQLRHRELQYARKSENFHFGLFDVYSCDDKWFVFS